MLDSEILFLSPYQGLPVVSVGHAGLIRTLNDMNFETTTLLFGGMHCRCLCSKYKYAKG